MINIDEINTKNEHKFFDRKLIHHEDKAALLQDILCLANSLASTDRYIIYGIDNSGKKIGVQKDSNRRTSNQFFNWYAKISFNRRPEIEFLTQEENGMEFDILRIKNERYKPFFILKDYADDRYKKKKIKDDEHNKQKIKTVKTGIMYTRVGDTNGIADDYSLEQMFRERFYIEVPSIERISNYLLDRQHWKCCYDEDNNLFFYYEYFPEFTVSFSRQHREKFEEPWVKHFPDKQASSHRVFVKYHATVLHDTSVIWCDQGKFLTILPKLWSNIKNIYEYRENMYQTYYFTSDSLEYLINEMIKKTYKLVFSEFYLSPFPVFCSSKEANIAFLKDCAEGRSKFVYYYYDVKSERKGWIKDGEDMGELHGIHGA